MTRLLFATLCLILLVLIGGIASLNYLYFDYQNKEDKKECYRKADERSSDCIRLSVDPYNPQCVEHSIIDKSACDRM